MIDIRKLKELVRLMVDNDLTELDLRDSEEQVTMRRNNPGAMPTVMTAPAVMHVPTAAPQPAHGPAVTAPARAAPVSNGAAGGTPDSDEAGLKRIESPMVGTFYAQANPDSPPFVSVGAAVAPDKTVCIIEAMKIFNEIKAECSGTIVKVLVKNGEPVEFGQALFLVKPG
ncbi:MAG TPA: acetyl-CoA carboxylase biotin carboxyl carrier protein [Phycisphaerales bacterium]|jgi:acetyl-CoA carboxylase biotin carboxyl carrier protein|nr:acetyl-CoA carboxylase biotin carboxyl carrier protein [Phycisphaerales bacterium]